LRDVIATATAGAREQVRDALEQALRAAAAAGSIGDVPTLHRRMLEEMTADGPIPGLLEGQPDEIVVVGVTRVRINRGGHVSEGPSPFTCPSALEAWVSRVCRADFHARNPVTRGTYGEYAVHAIHEPRGAVVSLRRRTPAGAVNLDALVHNGILSPGMAKLLAACVVSRQNVLLCAGSGATARHLMAGLLSCAPPQELQVVLCNPVIDVGAFPQSAVVLTRTDAGDSTLDAALALGPDRLGVDELQWNEAGTIVGLVSRSVAQVLGVRAATASLGLGQLESMLATSMLQTDSARRMLMRSVDVIVALQLFSDGVARVTQVAEPVLDDSGRLGAQDIFTLVPGSRSWQWSGVQPLCFQDLVRRGFPIDASIFS
jgi:pilus assembly protein CpaF